jgi:SPX domain protein involved in polyphosphate accumulation
LVSEPREDLRYEIKMVCQGAAYHRLLMRLRMDPAGLSTLYPPRRVQSVYLDDPLGTALEENLAGISHREKIRVRWYGEDATGVMATLECKVRDNMLGWKHTQRLAEPIDVEGVERRAFMRRVESLASAQWVARLQACLEPVQWISYVRDYLQTADGKVRVTIDRDVTAWDQRARRELSRVQRTPLPNLTIVEAKCSAVDYPVAQAFLSRVPLFVDRCSKFAMSAGIEHGPSPSTYPL